MRPLFASLAITAACITFGILAALVLTFGRPPQPLPLGSVQWLGEAGFTVDAVDRLSSLRDGATTLHPKGEFYVVHGRVIAPFGLRPAWHDTDAEVRTYSGAGGTMRGLVFHVDSAAQRLLDHRTGRPGPDHLIRGASQREELVFDLPRDVEQPGLVVVPANDPTGIVNWIFGHFWQPHRFNLRYD